MCAPVSVPSTFVHWPSSKLSTCSMLYELGTINACTFRLSFYLYRWPGVSVQMSSEICLIPRVHMKFRRISINSLACLYFVTVCVLALVRSFGYAQHARSSCSFFVTHIHVCVHWTVCACIRVQCTWRSAPVLVDMWTWGGTHSSHFAWMLGAADACRLTYFSVVWCFRISMRKATLNRPSGDKVHVCFGSVHSVSITTGICGCAWKPYIDFNVINGMLLAHSPS